MSVVDRPVNVLVSYVIIFCLSTMFLAFACGAITQAATPTVDLIYATDPLKNQVHVIDIGSNATVDTLNGFCRPMSLAVSPDSSRVYVTDSDSNTTVVIDAATHQEVARIPAGYFPYGIALYPGANKAYVTNQLDGTVSVFDTMVNLRTGTLKVGMYPRDVCVNPRTGDVYVINGYNNSISFIKYDCVVLSTSLGGYLRGMAVSPDGSRLLVTNSLTGVYVVDTANYSILSSFGEGDTNSPLDVAFSPDGALIYVCCFATSRIEVFSTGNYSLLKRFNVTYPSEIIVGSDGNVLYVVSQNKVVAMDAATGAILHEAGEWINDIGVVRSKLTVPDHAPPVTALNVSGPSDGSGAFAGYAVCELTASDGENGSGVKSIDYYLPGSAWCPYGGPIRLTTPGNVTLYYHATDNAGNIETVQSRIITITAPQDTVTPSPPPCPSPSPTPAAESPTGTATPTPTPKATPAPGFEILLAITGLSIVGCLALSRKR